MTWSFSYDPAMDPVSLLRHMHDWASQGERSLNLWVGVDAPEEDSLELKVVASLTQGGIYMVRYGDTPAEAVRALAERMAERWPSGD